MKDETPFLPKPKTLTGAYVAFLYDIPANSHLYEFGPNTLNIMHGLLYNMVSTRETI